LLIDFFPVLSLVNHQSSIPLSRSPIINPQSSIINHQSSILHRQLDRKSAPFSHLTLHLDSASMFVFNRIFLELLGRSVTATDSMELRCQLETEYPPLIAASTCAGIHNTPSTARNVLPRDPDRHYSKGKGCFCSLAYEQGSILVPLAKDANL